MQYITPLAPVSSGTLILDSPFHFISEQLDYTLNWLYSPSINKFKFGKINA